MSPPWHTRDELLLRVTTLARQGVSRRGIARALGVSRNTVKVLLRVHAVQRDEPHSALQPKAARAPRAKIIDAYAPRIAALMDKYPDITVQRVFEILRDEGFTGGHTAVKKHMRIARPKPKPAPSLATPDYGPGEMGESDWSPYKIRFTTGKLATIQALSYVLVHSKRKFFELYESSDLHALMDGHELAFSRFEGCARECKYDSQKPVVLRWEGNQPIYNPRFLAFSSHYEFRPIAVRRGHPNDKPRTERSFWEVERSFLNAREFRDLADMREQLARWLDTVVDHRRLYKRTALERFGEESPHLVPLPRHPYDTARVIYRLCSIDGFVAWEGNRYAVPYDHVTDILPVRITQQELFVYAADLRCVARHELGPRGAGLSLDPAGLHPPPRRRQSVLDLDQLHQTFVDMGEHAAEFFRAMSLGTPRMWAPHARQILMLRERYCTDDVDAALGHAVSFGAFDVHAVERILTARAPLRTLDEYVAEQTTRRIEQTLGHARTEPRDLSEYDRLPLSRAHLRRSQNTEDTCRDETKHPQPMPLTAAQTLLPNDCEDTSTFSD
ncbi:MAG TPA: IS21 family transposase [Polyangiales bacterium]|nr:IS21 family transposase [Polyangiales bacterium]